MNPDHCLLERDGHVLTLTLNRPEAKNALSAGMLARRSASPSTRGSRARRRFLRFMTWDRPTVHFAREA
jgi:hypothetical protein